MTGLRHVDCVAQSLYEFHLDLLLTYQAMIASGIWDTEPSLHLLKSFRTNLSTDIKSAYYIGHSMVFLPNQVCK